MFFGAPRAARAERPKRIRTEKPKAKVAPHLVAKARELRDRYLEHVNDGRMILGARGKYDVSRALSGRVLMQGHALPSPTAA